MVVLSPVPPAAVVGAVAVCDALFPPRLFVTAVDVAPPPDMLPFAEDPVVKPITEFESRLKIFLTKTL